jgi:WD40 repeat protein
MAVLPRKSETFRIGLAFSPDGKTLAYSQTDQTGNTLMLWDLETGNRTALGTLQGGGAIDLEFNANGRTLICGERPGISLWDIPTRSMQKRLGNHTEQVVSVALSPNGKLLASASGDQTVRLWDTESWEETRILRGHEHEVHSVTFSPDGRKLLSCGKDQSIRIWDVDAKPTSHETYTCPQGWLLMPGSPDTSRQLLIQMGNGNQTGIGFLELTRCEEEGIGPSPIPLAAGQFPGDVSGDLSKLAILRADGSIEIWGTMPLAKLKVIEPSLDGVQAIAISRTGRWLAAGQKNGNVEIRDLTNDRLSKTLDPLPLSLRWKIHPPLSFWAQDTRFVRVIWQPGELTESIDVVLFPQMESRRITLTHKEPINNFSLSKDGNLLATCAWDGQLKLWDITTGKEIQTLIGQFVAYTSLAFSPDDSRLAAGAWDGNVTLWDLAYVNQVA